MYQDSVDLLLGAYSVEDGPGLFALTYQRSTEAWTLGAAVDHVANASYGAYNAKTGVHYFVDERDNGRISTCRRTTDGSWQCLISVPSGGDAPCFLAVNDDCTALAVANYKSGSIALFRLSAETGLTLEPPSVYRHSGHGPNAERQEGPHAHCVQFHGGFLYSTDLGTDELLAFPVGRDGELGQPFTAFRFPAGEGPRHIRFHPALPLAYVVTELHSHIFILSVQGDGRLAAIETLSTLPSDFSGSSLGGHLELDATGERLYVSNRGHDSIATFAVSGDGRLRLMQIAPSHGESPRYFRLLEDCRRMIVAHQNGNTVIVLAVNDDGTLGAPLKTIDVHAPAFISPVH